MVQALAYEHYVLGALLPKASAQAFDPFRFELFL
jgi:hypothetical protein